ncbi:hypothetical protein KY290_024212 [Solanum tuberosum]|uniref:ATPase AAA-type core domain-containing protein n=1 Tax=Solanum tuberosum TaxID=4113 RepID=A0ABQ7UQ19_SOLTU|nr:hypothetical protein KY290_024212 [Solanum tuberosum]
MANFVKYDVYDLELTSVKDNTELTKLLIDTTGQRETNKKKKEEEDKGKNEEDAVKEKMKKEERRKKSKVRLIVFTTNYVEKLDPALIRRGRMDKHIVLSYCCFESFKIRRLLEETTMTPADIAENFRPKSSKENADTCLERLIKALETAKEEAKLKAEEEERAKATEEAKNADGVDEKDKFN